MASGADSLDFGRYFAFTVVCLLIMGALVPISGPGHDDTPSGDVFDGADDTSGAGPGDGSGVVHGAIDEGGESWAPGDAGQYMPMALTIRDPIRINGDGEFTAPNGVSGGAGTSGDPYIIEDYDINGSDSGYAVFIGNTTKYFVVRDCDLHHSSGNGAFFYQNAGVMLFNATNGTVSGNTVHDASGNGIHIIDCPDLVLTDNVCQANGEDGIYLTSYQGALPSSGLVANWKMDEASWSGTPRLG